MHARNWKLGVFRALDMIVVLVMILSSPLTVYAVVADVTTGANTVEANPVVAVEPLDTSPGIEEAPAEEQAVMPEEAWNTLASTLNLAGPQSPALDGSGNADVVSGVGCMQESTGSGLNCTANDISIANATNITILDNGCAFPGDTVTFKADFEVLLTAQARYDIGLWFSSDGDPNGDAAKTGSCSAATPAYAPDPPWLDLDQFVDGQADDTCGDIDDAHNPLYPSVTLTVVCTDDDANGKLDLPNCTSWRQPGDNSLCTSPVQAVPGAPSKCKCDTGFNIDIPVPGQIIVDKVTSPSDDPTTFNFTLTGGPGNVNIPFSLTDASAPFKSTNLMGGTYSVVETTNPSYSTSATCSDGSPANAIALAPGEIVTCTFTNTLQTGTLIVEKDLINDNSGTKSCADFSFSIDDGSATAFVSDCSNSVTVLAGSHTVVETGIPIEGYTTTYNNCSNVNVPAGGTATCTITNDDVAMPGMTVEKSSATTELTAPGTVTYSYLVTNTGNTSLTGIALSDNNDNDDMVCETGTLAKGESMTCTATHTFTQAELDAGGTLDNTVTADSNETEPVTDSLSIPIKQNAAIYVEKSSTTTVITGAGQVVPYTFVVTNTGNQTLTSITVADPNCDAAPAYQSGDANDDEKLQVDEAWTYICDHTVTQAEIDLGGSLSNTVTADSYESEPDTDTLDIPITQSKAILVVKASTTVEIFEAGQVVPYTFTVDNDGNTTLTGITVSDPMCDEAPEYISGDDGDAMLQVNETWLYTCDHTVTQAEIDSKGGGDMDLDNTVTADSNESEPDTDDHAIPIDYYPFLTVEKSSETTILSAPGTVTYSYLVKNTGNVTLTGIVLSDDNDEDDMSCPATTLAPEQSMTCTATHIFTQAELDTLTSLDNIVTADSNESAPDTDDWSIPITKNAAIIVVKASSTVEIVEAGQVVPYTFTVDNEGNTTLTGVTVSDPKCDAAPVLSSGDANNDGMLQVDETWVYTCNHTVTQAEIDSDGGGDGDLDNTVTADSNESLPDTDDHAIPIDYNPLMTVDKSSTTTFLSAPATVTYSYLVTNTGNVTLTGIALSDNNDNDDMSCPATTLAPEVSMTCTATHTFTQAELDTLTSLDNIVTADSEQTEPVTDNLSIPITKNAAIIVVKASTTTQIVEAGQFVPYTFTVNNEGNTTLTGIIVTDPMCDAVPAYVSGDSNLDNKLQIDETWVYTCNHTVTQAEIDSNGGGDGDLDNTVTADSTESDPATDDLAILVDYNPLLDVAKSSTLMQITAAGQVVPYTFLVDNIGNVTLTGITVTDAKCDAAPALVAGGDIDTDNELDVDETWTYTCNHTVTLAEIDTKGGGDEDLDNTVTADSAESASDTADYAIPIVYNPVLMVVKSSTTAAVTAAGQLVDYTFDVTNEGNVTLTGITVADGMCDAAPAYHSGDSNNDEKLDLAETWRYTCTHTVTQAEMDAGGNLHNIVLADSIESEPDIDELNIPITQNNAIIVVKASTTVEIAEAGQVVPYTFTVNNQGNTTLTGITVIDPMCDAAPAYVSGDMNGDNKLQIGETWAYSCNHTVTQAEVDAGGNLVNTVTADSNESEPDTDTLEIPVTQNPLIALTKSGTFEAGADGYANVGELISYEFLVSNEGNVTLTGVTVTDPKVSPITCPADTLDVGESMTCTGTYEVTQADIDAGFVYNLATADSEESKPDDGENNEPLPQNAALALVKTGTFGAGDDGFANVGELISYTFEVTNTGNVTLMGITVTDPKVSDITCPAVSIPVGQSITCTGTYAVTQTDIDAGSVYNLATADSTESGPDTDEETVPLPQNPAISIVKNGTFDAGADGYANVGELISYEFLVTNEGNVTLTGVTVTDPKVSPISCTADTLAVGASMTCTGTYAVSQADIDAGSVYNIATADSTQSEPDNGEETVLLPQNPAISLTKSAAPTTYDAPGDVIVYSYVITNTGNVTLPGPFLVTDDKATVTCDPAPAGGVAPQGTFSCTATYTITQPDVDAGYVTNTATASTTYNDQNVTSEPASATVTAIQNPAIEVLKSGTFMDENDDGYADVGETIAYTFTVRNTGNVTLYNIVVTDPLVTVSGGPLASLAPGAVDTTTFTAIYTLTQDDIDAGSVYNKATACGYDAQNDEACDDGTNDEPTPQNPAIELLKSGTFDAGADGYATTGEIISYTFTVKNIGNVTLTGITVTDPKVSPITCPQDTLAVGESMTCTGTYAVTQTDIDTGSVYNMATADSTQSEPDTDEETETLPQNPALMVEKTVTSTGPYDSVSDVITYELVATNTGNVTLTAVSITDPLLGTLTCSQPVSLAPGATLTCTGSYAITQTDLDNGKVDNTATATGTFGDDNYTDTDSETVPTLQSPAITLTKTATPTLYDAAGDVISYTLVAKNTGNVTLHDVSITDPLLGALTCTPSQPATLAPNATLTCTGTYTIQAADLTVFSITNTATVNGKGPQDQPVTATATATIYRQTGALLPTNTTCQQYAAGPSAWPLMYDAFTYQVKRDKISSVAPGVIFYYNTIQAPSASFTISVTQTNSLSWKPMLVQKDQAILYTSNCVKAAGVKVTTTNNPYTVKFTVTEATPGAIYYIGIKYSPQNLVGQPVKAVGGVYPTSIYTFGTVGYVGSVASIPVKPK